MKPTRNIMKPMKGLWNCKHKVWAHKNDDDQLGFDDKKASENITALLKIQKAEDSRFAAELRKLNNSSEGKQMMRDIAFKGYR